MQGLISAVGENQMALSIRSNAQYLIDSLNEMGGKYSPVELILIAAGSTYVLNYLYAAYSDIDTDLLTYFKTVGFSIAKKLPFLNKKIMEELQKTRVGLEEDIMKSNKGNLYVERLPPNGLNLEQVMRKTDDYLRMNETNWKGGAVSGCVYGADDRLTELTTKVFEKFAWTNPMHADVFPDVRKMEAEVVRMVCNMFNGDKQSCGTMTSGGTESIMLACKAYRDLARSKGIRKPEMVIPITAHAAFDKAGQFFNIRVHHVPVDPVTKKVNPSKLRSYINKNTCMIVGSAPNFPTGAIDPIEELSKIAVECGVPLHVDACLGGFLIAFMEEAGYKMPTLFDYRCPGVTSISCDTHKYGYTPKGSSVITYRNKEYRKHQFFSQVNWPGGIYVSPTFAGSRAGSLIAMSWATMMMIGQRGYVGITKEIIETTRFIAKELRKMKEIYMMAEPDVSVVAFDSKEFNILRMLDEMSARGWHLNAIQNPTGIHLAVTKLHTAPGVAQKFVDDVRSSIDEIMKIEDRQLGKLAAIYCSSQSVPDKSLIADVAYMFLDACYSTENKEAKNANGTMNGKAGH